MNKITKSGSTFCLDNYPWEKDFPARPETKVTISWDESGFHVHFVSYETNLRAVETAHNTLVCQDSCMEIFMQYAAETDPRYINIEINPNCAAYSAVSYDRGHSVLIDPADIDTLGIKTKVYDDRWEIDYSVSVAYIQKYLPSYRHEAGAVLRGNFYKCGDLTDHPHYACFNNIAVPNPDYHRPEFFAEFILAE